MNRFAFSVGSTLLATAISTALWAADPVTDTYSEIATGQPITAATMKNNLTNLKNAVNAINTGTGNCAGIPGVTGDTMVRVGSICVDKYEASIVSNVAHSVAGVLPATSVNWFTAANACAKAGKRLLTNAEWQMAATGTPGAVTSGPGCNGTSAMRNTGADSTCVSSYGVMDMAGNASEWVADWSPYVNAVDTANGDGGTGTGSLGIVRGGGASDGTAATIYYLLNGYSAGLIDTTLTNNTDTERGFRCAR